MKKLLIVVLILALVLALAACGEKNETNGYTEINISPVNTNSAGNQTPDAPPNNDDVIINSRLIGTWVCIEYGVHGNARYIWSFREDGRFAYLFSGYEPPHGGGDMKSSVRERFMQGRFRENGNTIECYDVQLDDFFSWGDNWRYFPDRDPYLLAEILLTTPFVESDATGDFTFSFEFVDKTMLRIVIDLGAFPDQYEMDFEFLK